LVSAGGDLFALGSKNGEAWKIGVADPRREGEFIAATRIANAAVGTSGDYERAFTSDYRFNHLIDPRTGKSPDAACAATVIAPTSMDADAIATTAVVLGPTRGLEFLRARNVEGVIVDKEQRQWRTEEFDG
jgi:thiamine biosynthesis lipoprotein